MHALLAITGQIVRRGEVDAWRPSGEHRFGHRKHRGGRSWHSLGLFVTPAALHGFTPLLGHSLVSAALKRVFPVIVGAVAATKLLGTALSARNGLGNQGFARRGEGTA